MKHIYLNEKKLLLLKEWQYDNFEIGEVERIYYNIRFEPYDDEDYEEDEGWYYVDVTAYDYNGETVYECYDEDIDNLKSILGETIIQAMMNKEGYFNGSSDRYCLDMCDYQNFSSIDDAINGIFKSNLTEYYPKLHGYILTNGMCIDLGHNDHNFICALPQINDKFEFIALGNIRCSSNFFDLIKKPTYEQKQCLRKLIANTTDLSVDIFDENGKTILTSVVYRGKVSPSVVLNQIDRFFGEGIKLNPNVDSDDDYLYENCNYEYKTKSILNELVKTLITESQESKSQSEAIKYLMQNMNWDKATANNFVRNDLRQDITALRDKNIAKFTLGVTRMYCNRELSDARIINDLNATLKLLSAHLNEYDRNLNGISAQELIDKFAQTRQDNIDAEKGEIDSMDLSQSSRYQIVPINSFEEAQNYYEYTNPNSRWCLTHMNNMFDSYTRNGMNQIYFCLREGFENEPCEVGENAPLDDYGLSMLSIIVNENGELAYCTTRWNHDNGGTDSSMSAKEVSQVVGVNFYQVFKPNNKWQMIVDDAINRLSNGEDPRNIFDVFYDFHEGFARVYLKGKYNFINTEGQLLSPNQWFNDAENFYEGFAKVDLKGKYNFINIEGQIAFPNQWFINVDNFHNGFARVYLKGKYNFINTEGQYVSKDWFDGGASFYKGFAQVYLDGKGWNFINTEGQLVSPNQWFDGVRCFREDFAEVRVNGKGKNFINIEGLLLSPNQWFDSVDDFHNGFAKVKLKGKYNFINTEGQLLSPNQWFDEVYNFFEGFAKVKLKGKYNFINTERQLISPNQWFDKVEGFYEGFAKVKLKGEGYNFINTKGQLVSPNQWFDKVYDFYKDLALVKINEKGYYLDTEGNLYDKNQNLIRNLKTESRFYKSSLIENYNNEYNQNDVDMSSFEKQTSLQQDLWDSEDKLNSRARLKLLDIADDFIETLGISWIKPIDIILTGSLCNYNWSSYSDVDLHIIINFAEINEKKHFVEEYFKLKKNEWNESHQNLKIYGFNVELYVEDVENDSVHDGVYSLEKNIWIKKPFPEKLQPISNEKEEKIKYLASIALTKIEELEYEFNEPSDEIKLEKLSYKIDKLLDTLKKVRQNGLNKKGEMSVGNIIYKICRRSGYLDKLWDLKNKVYDKKNSL